MKNLSEYLKIAAGFIIGVFIIGYITSIKTTAQNTKYQKQIEIMQLEHELKNCKGKPNETDSPKIR